MPSAIALLVPGFFFAGMVTAGVLILAHDFFHVRDVMRRNYSLSHANRVLHAQRDADELRHQKDLQAWRTELDDLHVQLAAARQFFPGMDGSD